MEGFSTEGTADSTPSSLEERENIINEGDPPGVSSAVKEDHLRDLGIETYNMDWQTYVKEVRRPGAPRLDSMFITPCNGISHADVQAFCIISKREMNPGTYGIMFGTFQSLIMWGKAMLDAGFIVGEAPTVVTYSNTVCHNITHTPRNHLYEL